MSEKITMKKNPVPNSSRDASEVFVLPPQLLQKLGIDLCKVQDDSNVINNEPFKSMPMKIKTKSKRRQTTRLENKTISKQQDSSILETAQLMKTSVFLSPTFNLTSSDVTVSGTAIKNDDDDDDNIPLSALAKQKFESNYVSSKKTANECNDILKNIINESNTTFEQSKLSSIILSSDGLLKDSDNVSKLSILETCLTKKPVSDIGEKLCSDTMVMFGCSNIPTLQAIQPIKTVDDHVDEAYGSDYANSNSGASGITDIQQEHIKNDETHNFKALEAEIIAAIDDNLIGKVLSADDFTLTPINMDDIILMSDKDTEKMAVTFSDIIITDSSVPITSTDTNHIESQYQQVFNDSFNEEDNNQTMNQDLEDAALLLNIAQMLPGNDTSASTSLEPSVSIANLEDANKLANQPSASTSLEPSVSIANLEDANKLANQPSASTSLEPSVSIANLEDSNNLANQCSLSEKCGIGILNSNNAPRKVKSSMLMNNVDGNLASEKTEISVENKNDNSDKNLKKTDTSDKVHEIASYLSKCAYLLQKYRINKLNKNTTKKTDKKEGAEKPGGRCISPSNSSVDVSNVVKTYKRTSSKAMVTYDLKVPQINVYNTEQLDYDTNQETRVKQIFCICSDFGHLDYSYFEDDMNQHVHYVNKVTFNSDVSYQLCDVNYVEYIETAIMNQVEIKEDTTDTSDFMQSCWGSLPCIEPSTDTQISIGKNIRNQISVNRSTYEKSNKNVNIFASTENSRQITTNNNIKSPSTISISNYDGLNHNLALQNNRQQEDTPNKQAKSRPNLNFLSQNIPIDSNNYNQDRSSFTTKSNNTKEINSCVNYVKLIDDGEERKTTFQGIHGSKSNSGLGTVQAEYASSSITNTNSCNRLQASYKSSNKNETANVCSTYKNVNKYTNQSRTHNLVEIKETENNHVPNKKADICDNNTVIDSNCKNTDNIITPNNDIVLQNTSLSIVDNSSNESIEAKLIINSGTFKAIETENSLLLNTEMNDGKEKTKNNRKRRLQPSPGPVVEKKTRLSKKSVDFEAKQSKIETTVKQTPDKKELKTFTRYGKRNNEKTTPKSPKLNESFTKTLETNNASCSILPNKTENKERKCYKSARSKKLSDDFSLNISSEPDNNAILEHNLIRSLDTESTMRKDTNTLENDISSVSAVSDPSKKHGTKLNGLSMGRKRKLRISSGSNQDQDIETQSTKTENIDKKPIINIESSSKFLLKEALETANKKVIGDVVKTATDQSKNTTDNGLTNGCIENVQMNYADTESHPKKILNRKCLSKSIDTLDTKVTPSCSNQSQSNRQIASKRSVKEIAKPVDTIQRLTNRKNNNSQTTQKASKISTDKIDSLKTSPSELDPKNATIDINMSLNQLDSPSKDSQMIVSDPSLQSNNSTNTSTSCGNTMPKSASARRVEARNKSELEKKEVIKSLDSQDGMIKTNNDSLVLNKTESSVTTDQDSKIPTPCRRSYSKSSDSETLITKQLRKSKRSSISALKQSIVITEAETSVKIDQDSKIPKPCRRSYSKSSDSETLITKKLRKSKRSSIVTSNQFTDNLIYSNRKNSQDKDPQTSTECLLNLIVTTPDSETSLNNKQNTMTTNKKISKINMDRNHSINSLGTSNTSDNTDSDIQIFKPCRRSYSKSSDSEPLLSKKNRNSSKSSPPSDTYQSTSNIDKNINVSNNVDVRNTTSSEFVEGSSDNTIVKCCVCNESMPKSEWYDHSGAQHLYKAWNDQEPALDLDNNNDVKKHILAISKVINGLKCYRCNYVTKFYSTLLKHLRECDKKEMKEKLKATKEVVQSVDIVINGKNNVMCCICMKQILRKRWTDHAMIEHYNIAWNNEEEPIDISISRHIERRLKSYKETFNKLECRKCGTSRASALGFFAHVIACGKCEEELDKFKETCDICTNKYLAVYRQQHYLNHKVQEQKQAMLEERRKLAEAAREKSPDIVTPGKRRAAQKAINVIAGVQKALSQIPDLNDGSGTNTKEDEDFDCDSSESVVLSEHSESESDEYDENVSDDQPIPTDNDDDVDDDDDDDDMDERRRRKKKMPTLQWRLGRMPFIIEDIYSYITKSIKQHFSSLLNIERVHTNWNNDFKLMADSDKQRYMKLLQESCSVKTGGQWSKYEPFEVRTDPVFSIFVGSSPRSVCWVPAIEDVEDDNYLTISCYNSTDCPRYRCDDIYTQDTFIQIWNFHMFQSPPELAFCIALDYGVVWSMDWCPTGARDNPEESSDNPRLGLLAIACSDGNVYVMAIPHPSNFKEDKPLIKPNPAAILRLSTSSHRNKYQATAVCWSKEKDHKTLMVGYADGTVAHYDLKTESPFLKTVENGIPILLPYQDEVVHSNYITNVLSQWPGGAGGGEGAQGACSAGGVSMWAGRTLHSSLNISATDAAFIPHWTSVFAAMEDRTASQNECEWFMGGRRIGCGRAVATCFRCGNFAVAHSPWISAMRPHPASPDLKRQTFAKIAVVPLNQKSKKPGGSTLDTKLEPLTYEETIKKYGIELTLKSKKEQTERKYDIVPERFPLSEVSSIAYCPSAGNHHRLAAATHAGIIFILNAPKINICSRNSC